MVREAEIFLHLGELVRQDDGEGIFLAVNGLGFKGGVQLAEAHRHRVGAERAEGLEVHRIRDDPYLDAAEVLTLGDRTPAVRHVPEAQVPEPEADEILLGQFRQKRSPKRPVQQRIGLLRC